MSEDQQGVLLGAAKLKNLNQFSIVNKITEAVGLF